jgi:hypothetical protein
MGRLRETAESMLARRGFVRAGAGAAEDKPADIEPEFWQAYQRCRPFTMTSLERCYALWKAARHVADAGIPGDVVECGVWRGGSSMLAALGLMSREDLGRRLHLFDTFEGMTPPTDDDVSAFGEVAQETWASNQREAHNDWCYADRDDVRRNMDSTGYPADLVNLVQGPVEKTIPDAAPESIAILRLDTDWYESTAHELRHLYPRLARGGVLIVDDYGHWQGARRAVDEYFGNGGPPVLLSRIDYTGRIGIRVD